MSNQAYSVSEDLMVGAGVLYFRRDGDTNGYHHLGNVDEFNITNDVEKIDKNSSMNKKRELMASVITSIKPTASITMTEYNPYNLALGLYGTEGVLQQQGTTLTNESYTVPSVPGIITLTDANGNRYMDVKNVVVSVGTATPASVVIQNGVGTDLVPDATNANIFNDGQGGTIEINPGTWNGSLDISSIMIGVSNAGTPGDVNGVTVLVQEFSGATQTLTCSGSGLTDTMTIPSGSLQGLEIKLTLNGASDTFTATASSGTLSPTNAGMFDLRAPVSTLTEGRDYTLDPQELRAGIIKIKDGGRLSKGDTVRISATVPDGSYPTVNGGNAGDISGELLFIGDPNIGGQYNIEGWKVKITPEGDLTGLIGTEFGTFTLTVDFLSDYEHHPECPYYRATMIGRASGNNSVSGVYDPKY